MERREFLKTLGMAGSLAALGCVHTDEEAIVEAAAASAPAADEPVGESRRAWRELQDLMRELDGRYLGPEWGIESPGDIADGHRYLMHVLQSGTEQWLEADPARPRFVRFVNPRLKLLGDNPDALYFTTALDPTRRYRVRGNVGGAVYTSLTLEGGNAEGHYPKRVAAALNDTAFDVAEDGSFEIDLGPEAEGPGRLALPPDTGTLTTRHYFEDESPVAMDPQLGGVRLSIEPLDATPPPPTPDDARIAASIRRVMNYVRGVTLEQPRLGTGAQPSWVSMVPNTFLQPERWKPGEGGFGAVDNAYAMAPYVVRPDQALILEGRWPEGRFGSVLLWNRFMQTYDYVHRRVSLNRKQTQLESDGSFRIVVAHRDPGVPNWIDAEGRPVGLIFWRFLMPEGELETPQARVVPLENAGAA